MVVTTKNLPFQILLKHYMPNGNIYRKCGVKSIHEYYILVDNFLETDYGLRCFFSSISLIEIPLIKKHIWFVYQLKKKQANNFRVPHNPN